MAYDDDDDLDPSERWDGNVRNLPAGLRKHVRALEKQKAEADVELATLRKDSRTRTIQNVLAAKGVNPKVAAFIQPDVEATPEALGKWIEDYAEVFNVTPAAQTQTQQTSESVVDPRTGQASGIPEPFVPQTYTLEQANTQAQMDAVAQGATPVQISGDLLAKIAAANTFEEMETLRGVTVRGGRGT